MTTKHAELKSAESCENAQPRTVFTAAYETYKELKPAINDFCSNLLKNRWGETMLVTAGAVFLAEGIVNRNALEIATGATAIVMQFVEPVGDFVMVRATPPLVSALNYVMGYTESALQSLRRQ